MNDGGGLRGRLKASAAHEQAGRFDEAECIAARVVERKPVWPAALRRHASVASARQDWLAALQRWERVIEAVAAAGGEPTDTDWRRLTTARVRAANVHLESGWLEESERLLEAALAREPDNLQAWYVYVRAASRRKDWAVARLRQERLLEVALRTGRSLSGPKGDDLARLIALTQAAGPHDIPPEVASGALVFVEKGAHPFLAAQILDRLRPGKAIGDARMEGLTFATGAVEPIRSVTIGGPHDVALASQARALGERLFEAVLGAVPPDTARWRGLPLLETLRYDVISRTFGNVVTMASCRDDIDPEMFPGVVFAAGDGHLEAIFGSTAVRVFGEGRVFRVDSRFRAADPALPLVAFRARPPSDEDPGGLDGLRSIVPFRPPRLGRTATRGERHPMVLAWRHQERTLVPVVRELAQGGPVTVIVVADHPRWAQPYDAVAASDLPVDVRFLTDQPERARPRRKRHEDARLRRALSVAVQDPTVQKVLGEVPDLATKLAHDIAWLFGGVPTLRRFSDALRRELAAARPSIVTQVRDRAARERISLALAREIDVPTLAVQPVLMSRHPMYNRLEADYTTAFDTTAHQLFLDHLGARPEQVFVTGFPAFDTLTGRGDGTSVPDQPPMVLFTMQRYSLEEAGEVLRLLAGSLDGGTTLVVKPHPREPIARAERYAAILREVAPRQRYEVVTGGDTQELIRRSSLVVSGWSNTLIEAAITGRPALSVNLSGEPLPVPLEEMGVACEAKSAAEVRNLVAQLLSDTPQRDELRRRQEGFLAANPHLVDGIPAARRIAAVARDIAARHAGQRSGGIRP